MLRTVRPSRLVTGAALAAGLLLAGCAHHRDKAPKLELAPAKITQIGVNAYLWRAALDTVSFMPLTQVDSNGGVIVTDWYANPGVPGERMRVTISILDQDLRADAVRVAIGRQVSQGGGWADAPVAAQTVQRMEDIIVEHARDLRRGAISG